LLPLQTMPNAVVLKDYRLLVFCLALMGCGASAPAEEAWVEERLAGMSIRAQAGQLVVRGIVAAEDSGGAAAQRAELERAVQVDSIGGIVIRGGDVDAVEGLTRRLHQVSALPLLAAVPVDAGVGATVGGATVLPHIAGAAGLLTWEQLGAGARLASDEARQLGLNLALVGPLAAPSPRNVIPTASPEAVRGYLGHLRGGGMLVSVSVPVLSSSSGAHLERGRRQATEQRFLREGLEEDPAAVHIDFVSLPMLLGNGAGLPRAPEFLQGELRRDLGFQGVIALRLGASGGGEAVDIADAAVRAIAAGVDLLLDVDDHESIIQALVEGVSAGRISAVRIRSATERVLRMKYPLRGAARGNAGKRSAPGVSAFRGRGQAVARELWRASLLPLGAFSSDLADTTVLVTPMGHGHTLAAELVRLGRQVHHVEVDTRVGGDSGFAEQVGARRSGGEVVIAEFPRAGEPSIISQLRGIPVRRDRQSSVLELRFVGDPGEGSLPESVDAVIVWGSGVEAERSAAELITDEGFSRSGAGGDLRWPPARLLRAGAAAEAGMSEAGLRRADALLQNAVEAGLFPGAALAVGRRGVLVRLTGYGHLSREVEAPRVDPSLTLYDLASLTKVVGSTAAAMALVSDGRLSLDDAVHTYLPEFTGDDRERVRVRDLLAHTAGLPAGLAIHANARSPEDALRRVLATRLTLVPGQVAHYSDLSMILLAEALSRAAGEGLDQLLAGRVFSPLGMNSTMYLPPLSLRAFIAPTVDPAPDEFELRGIVHDGAAFRLGGITGHAGLFSTAYDVAVFSQAMLNLGAYGTRQVFAPEVVATFRERQPRASERALGWDTPAPESSAGSYFSSRSFGHTGFTGTSIWIDPEKELFVVLLTNRTYDRTSLLRMLQIRQQLHDAVALSITDTPVRKRPGAVDVIPLPQFRPPSRLRR
jgi:beta-N-acetylhexosaminidase